jgi:hypothetical protein
MSMAPAAPVAVETRLRPAINVLWASGPTTSTRSIEAGFAALSQAVRRAGELWPEYYFGEPVLRLVYDPAAPPSSDVLATAGRAGLEPAPYAGADELRAAVCDIVATGGNFEGRISLELPGLAFESDGARLFLPSTFPLLGRVFGVAQPPTREERTANPTNLAQATLAPPRGSPQRAALAGYQVERPGGRPLRFEYELLLRLIGERPPSNEGEDDSWVRAAELAVPGTRPGLAALRRDYERADALALAYGRRWRSRLAARSFLLFAANLASGVVGALFPRLSAYTLLLQTVATGLIYVDQFVSRRGKWRGKWLDYRRLAEALRVARFCLLGGAPVPVATPPTWIDWRVVRAIRAAAAPAAMTEAEAPAFLAFLCEVEIDRQIQYHAAAHRRFRRMDTRLRHTAAAALIATLALGVGFALAKASGVTRVSFPLMSAVGLAVSAGPGLYAALNGLRLQLDLARQGERSARIGVALRRLRRAIAASPSSPAVARAAAFRAAEIMHEDVLSWDRVMEIV